MKFISLRRKEGKTPFDTVLKIGCGPNFVLNRKHIFQRMILEQGTSFWFRFWLSFCFNPGCHYLNTIKEQIPDMMDAANIYIHKEFLQGSSLDACQYCLKIMKIMRLFPKGKAELRPSQIKIRDSYTMDTSLQGLLIRCLEMVFGAALCEIFYKWLANEGLGSRDYWSIPEEYLNPEFNCGLLEEYLVCAWGESLYLLLNDPQKTIPWVGKLLREMNDGGMVDANLEESFNSHEQAKSIRKLTQVMNDRREQRLKEILAVDEMPNKMNNVGLLLSMQDHKHNRQQLKLRNGKSLFPLMHRKSPHHCAFCIAEENEIAPFKMCKQCVDEKWAEPRYYCCVSCQIEHWFKKHQKEHFEFERDKTNNSDKRIKENVNSPPSSFKYYIFNCFLAIVLILSFRTVFGCLFILLKIYMGFYQ